MQNIKVLMAEDEPDILEIMSKRIASEGYEVITARDGMEAWDKIQRESPDIILLDLMMPGRDGFEVLQNLRENPPSEKWKPVIIVSAKGELDDMKKGYSLEADHYITKPCDVHDILKAIKLMVNLIPQRKSQGEFKNEDG